MYAFLAINDESAVSKTKTETLDSTESVMPSLTTSLNTYDVVSITSGAMKEGFTSEVDDNVIPSGADHL